MNRIGFTNFRKFKEFPPIDLGDITILVGGNNAGKSTLVKAMLLMRDFLKSRIESAANTNNIFSSFKPQFSFDTEHVNIGEFYRAFCRQSPSKKDTISFTMKIDKFSFAVNIKGERKPGVLPKVSLIAVSDDDENAHFTFDYDKHEMTARFVFDAEALNGSLSMDFPIAEKLKELKVALARSKDLNEISRLKLRIEQLEKEQMAQVPDFLIEEYDEVTIPLSFYMGDNVGELFIPELINGFAEYAETGTLGDKRSKEYKKEEANKALLKGKASIIKAISEELKSVLNNQVIEYIYAHSVSQKPFYADCVESLSSDYTKRTIHEFYNARISSGDDEFSLIEEWLEQFEIGKSLKVISNKGDNYSVVIFDKENPEIIGEKKRGYPGGMDLADKGMGSIQLVVLLLRIATFIRKYKGQQLTILLEEPEQNLHPALQSKLAELLFDINERYDIHFVIETHSEYLVRHTQVLAAKQLYENGVSLNEINESIKVYYLSLERGMVDMLFLDNAKFQDSFDEGFFDQAARESLTISRLERMNKNK